MNILSEQLIYRSGLGDNTLRVIEAIVERPRRRAFFKDPHDVFARDSFVRIDGIWIEVRNVERIGLDVIVIYY